jgi:hypothetical protein
MATLIKTAKQSEVKTPIEIGSKVTFIGNLPGGYYDNYSGYSNRGAVYGTVIKKFTVNCQVMTKIGDIYKVAIKDLTNIEDLF